MTSAETHVQVVMYKRSLLCGDDLISKERLDLSDFPAGDVGVLQFGTLESKPLVNSA